MTPLLFAMVASFLAATGARDQILVARLAGSLGASPALLVVALASSALTAGIAAWFGAQLAQTMSVNAATMFVAIALVLARFECGWPTREKTPREPTRSLGAAAAARYPDRAGHHPVRPGGDHGIERPRNNRMKRLVWSAIIEKPYSISRVGVVNIPIGSISSQQKG